MYGILQNKKENNFIFVLKLKQELWPVPSFMASSAVETRSVVAPPQHRVAGGTDWAWNSQTVRGLGIINNHQPITSPNYNCQLWQGQYHLVLPASAFRSRLSPSWSEIYEEFIAKVIKSDLSEFCIIWHLMIKKGNAMQNVYYITWVLLMRVGNNINISSVYN